MKLTRRDFLRASAATSAALSAGALACRGPLPWERRESSPFRHGVASGDPLADRVVLWTRVTGSADERVRVAWRVARDPALREVVAEGRVTTGPERDHTVKVDPVGLAPGGTWYYRFEALGCRSPVGRTRTLPVGHAARLRAAVCSCSNYPQGFFNGYAAIARRADLDLVVHLGDYLYEYANGTYGDGAALGRIPDPIHEIVSLSDYRTRHAQYKTDPDLQKAHRQHPFVAVWDDHESANNAWRDGAQNHDPGEGDWAARKAAAARAYLEWMPIRELPGEPSSSARIHRSFRFGDLADLIFLDTRLLGRDAQAARDDAGAIAAPDRTLLGASQEAWLYERLETSQAEGIPWRILGQQVLLGHLALPGEPVNPDAWDGYPAARDRLFGHLERAAVGDVVVLTGDIHSSWALDVARRPFSARHYDPATGLGSLAVEFVAPALSSSPLASFPGLREKYANVLETHPHVRYADLEQRGYVLLDVDAERAQAEWWHLDTVGERSEVEHFAAAFATRRGESHLEAVEMPSAAPEAPPPAPA